MREIEFRGKSVISGKWVYGWLNATKESLKNDYYWIDVDEDSYQVDPETIGQYTGLKDKNGKKIFEGDILKVVPKERAIDNQDHYDYIVFSNGCFCMANALMFGELTYGCDYDVVGNIYDNKELLEEEDAKNS